MIKSRNALAVALASVIALLLASGSALADVSEVGIDADPTGNEPALLGEIEDCIEVAEGDTFDVDIYVKDVEELIAFRIWLRYDPAVLEISDRDVQQILTTAENTSVQDFSDPTPDSDGQYELTAANTSEPSDGASGSGVLARVTLTALGTGISELNLESHDIDGDGAIDRGIYLADIEGEPLSSDDDDIYYDGEVHTGAVAVGESCDDADTPVLGGDDSSDVPWLVVGIAAGALVMLGAVGLLAWTRRSKSPPASA